MTCCQKLEVSATTYKMRMMMTKLLSHKITYQSDKNQYLIKLVYDDMEITGVCDRHYRYARVLSVKSKKEKRNGRYLTF